MAVVYEAVLSERIIFGARRDEVSAKQRQVFLLEQSIQGVGKADIFYQHINTTARPQIFPLLDTSSNENSTTSFWNADSKHTTILVVELKVSTHITGSENQKVFLWHQFSILYLC